MNKLLTILIIAQNGLKVAAGLLTAHGANIDAQAGKTKDKKEAAELKKKATRVKRLAKILVASDEGISAYVKEEF